MCGRDLAFKGNFRWFLKDAVCLCLRQDLDNVRHGGAKVELSANGGMSCNPDV